MTNLQLFDSQMYREVIRQYEEVSEFINLEYLELSQIVMLKKKWL